MACEIIRSNTVIPLFIPGLNLTVRYSTVYYKMFAFLLLWYYPWDMGLVVSWQVRAYFKFSSNTNGTLLTVLKRFTHKVLVYGSISVHSGFYTQYFIIKIYRGIAAFVKTAVLVSAFIKKNIK